MSTCYYMSLPFFTRLCFCNFRCWLDEEKTRFCNPKLDDQLWRRLWMRHQLTSVHLWAQRVMFGRLAKVNYHQKHILSAVGQFCIRSMKADSHQSAHSWFVCSYIRQHAHLKISYYFEKLWWCKKGDDWKFRSGKVTKENFSKTVGSFLFDNKNFFAFIIRVEFFRLYKLLSQNIAPKYPGNVTKNDSKISENPKNSRSKMGIIAAAF